MKRRRIPQFICAVLVVVVATIWFTHRAQLHATWQVVTIAASIEDVPVASRFTRVFTGEPGAAVATTAGPLPATRVRTGGGDAAPALVLLVPGSTTSADLTDVRHAQAAIARAGFTAWAVRVGRAGSGSTSLEDDVPLVAAIAAIAADPSTANGAVSIAAAGADASRALVAASDPKVRGNVRAVLAIQPVADVQGLARLAVTGTTRTADGRDIAHPSAQSVRRDAGRSIVTLLRNRAGDLGRVEAAALARVEAADDPITAFARLPSTVLDPDLRAVRAALIAPDPAAFDAAWAQLPADVLTAAAELSPTVVARTIDARVLVIVPERDTDYPADDGERLARALAHARVRTSDVISGGAIRSPSSGELRALLGDAVWWLDAAND